MEKSQKNSIQTLLKHSIDSPACIEIGLDTGGKFLVWSTCGSCRKSHITKSALDQRNTFSFTETPIKRGQRGCEKIRKFIKTQESRNLAPYTPLIILGNIWHIICEHHIKKKIDFHSEFFENSEGEGGLPGAILQRDFGNFKNDQCSQPQVRDFFFFRSVTKKIFFVPKSQKSTPEQSQTIPTHRS